MPLVEMTQTLAAVLAIGLPWLHAGCQTPPQAAPGTAQSQPASTQPAPAPPPAPANVPPEVDALLTQLEQSAAELRAFTAAITYEKQDDILGRREIRTGNIIYQRRPDASSTRFAVLFDSLIVNGRKTSRLQHYVFDGRWLAEIDAENKQFIKREIIPPGKTLDPLKLGEGPFPLPIGQPKSEVLARFEVAAAPPPQDGLLKDLDPAAVDGLRLIPRPGTQQAKEFSRVDLYYDKATRLPIGINALEINGDRKTVRLKDLRRNPELDETALQKLSIAEPDPREWEIDVQRWQGETP